MIPRLNRSSLPALLAALLPLLAGGQIFAQGSDGTTLQERPGVALIKPQPWSKESDATVTEFNAFYDRTAVGGGTSGYYELHTVRGGKRQVESSRVVKIVIYPDADKIPDLKDSETQKKVDAMLTEINEVIQRFPSTKTYIQPYVGKLQAMLARYNGGEIKVEGEWLSKKEYNAKQAGELHELLLGDIVRAQPPGSFDLANDPKYIALQEMAEANGNVKRLLDAVNERQAMSQRSVKRKELVEKLKTPSLSLEEAQALIDSLKALKAEEDPVATVTVNKWDKSLEAKKQLETEATELAEEMEKEMASVQPDSVPTLSEGLNTKLSPYAQRVAIFFAGQPPVQIAAELKQAKALEVAFKDIQKLQRNIPAKQFLEAKGYLDELARESTFIGPETAKVFVALQKQANDKVEEFTRLRSEAQLLADSGDKEKALVKYEAAYEAVADKGVEEKIKELKGEEPAAVPSEASAAETPASTEASTN